jgi:glutathione synthase/RimK-type ligase-like ATP-grasp enzyme
VSTRIALATYERAPGLAPDDRLLIPALERLGIRAQPAIWSDRSTRWRDFDAVIIRSCWDYHIRFGEFEAWLAALDADAIPLWNPAPLVRWNADKRYLLDLAGRGVATVPTMIAMRGHADAVESLATAEGWDRFVIKPAISASGYETFALRTPLDDASRATIARVAGLGAVLVQPFADEIARFGELSFTFFDGAFSHATVKRARVGEFRVQTEHGGTVDSIVVERALIDQAAAVVRALDVRPLYARVDGITRGDAFLLMELELIEPNVFMSYAEDAADRFARAIAQRLG